MDLVLNNLQRLICHNLVELGEWWQIGPPIEVAIRKHTVSGLGQVANREQATQGHEL